MTAATPMLAQYLALKAEADDALLFYRMGDFYELFFEDAAAAAATLGIALTARGQHAGRPVPMCGVPVHAAQAYLARLIRAGHRVAIAEQTEDPAAARRAGRPVARAIARVVTPATLTEPDLLDARRSSWLGVVAPAGARVGLAWADVSTGAFHTADLAQDALDAELARLEPAELVAPEGWALRPATPLAAMHFAPAAAEDRLRARFAVGSLEGFGAFTAAEVAAAGALVAYVDLTQRGQPARLEPPRPTPGAAYMAIDAATRASLGLTRGPGALIDVIDRTVSGAGARLLAADLGQPLLDVEAIGARLDAVAWFERQAAERRRARELLARAPDLARIVGRLAARRGSARDLGQLRDALARAGELGEALADAVVIDCPPLLAALARDLRGHEATLALLERALVAEPGDEGFIATGFDGELDAARADAGDGRRLIVALEARYRAETGVASLKIRHNGVLGYHVEVPARAEAALRQAGFAHRQSLAGAARFGGEELAALAARIAGAGERVAAIEAAHLARLIAGVLDGADAVAATARAMARIDVAAALAELAARERWTRPMVDASRAFAIEGGRHPVVEAALAASRAPFVANDCDLAPATRVWLITGPNMGGKSTFLRQNALIAVLAQIGSFVPAASARIGVVDALFSRVGASDDLARGRSTFMVEMSETAAILRQASERSLVILDEVGRGTSTWDGLAIAWSVLEAVHDGLRCRCLFATHYHELTRLAGRLDALVLKTLRAREWRGELVFLHEVAAGAADRSYGLAVARLAGVPGPVLARAKAVLERLEAGRPAIELAGDLPLFAAAAPVVAEPDPLRAALAAIDLDALSPREAHAMLTKLQAAAGEGVAGGR